MNIEVMLLCFFVLFYCVWFIWALYSALISLLQVENTYFWGRTCYLIKLEEVFEENDATLKKPKKDYKVELIENETMTTVTAAMKNYHVNHDFLLFWINLLKIIFFS